MDSKVIGAILINVLYLVVWYFVYKLRVSKHQELRLWDNGYEFYDSLDKKSKELYWKEDTKIIHMFFIILLIFLEITLFLFCIYFSKWYWIVSLIIGIVISVSMAIVLSIRLQKKYQNCQKKQA